MTRLEEELRAAVAAYLAATDLWASEPGVEPDEAARRRILSRSHGERILRRLRAELQSVHTSFDRAAATAPDIYLAQPAHELWQAAAAALVAMLPRGSEAGELEDVRVLLSLLEREVAASRGR